MPAVPNNSPPSAVTCEELLAPSHASVTSRCTALLNSAESASARRSATYSLCRTLDEYLPEPALLDSVVPDLVRSLSTGISEPALHALVASFAVANSNANFECVELLPFRVLAATHKVRGPKLVCRYYPHDVARFAPLSRMVLFAAENLSAPTFWRVRAILFYWLANLALMPFPLSSFSTVETVTALANIALDALSSPSNAAQAAALFLARFVTRKDAGHLLENAVKKCIAGARDCIRDARRQGAFRALSAIFKVGRREVLAPYSQEVMEVAAATAEGSKTTVDAHLATKLAQRVALVHLPPRPCPWRYARGTRLLFGGAPPSAPSGSNEKSAKQSVTEHDNHIVVEETALTDLEHANVEQAVEIVLRALEHRDAIVRWSGAKGVGRIVARLDAEMAGEVALHVLGTFDGSMDQGSWNGACLALAELLRRGLILPESAAFGMTLSAVEKAAAFDVRRGAHSVGEHVRDAACYVVWALARAYESRDVKIHASRIAKAMLRVALFDREVHCRRAAAAALQECVGRMQAGVIVEGIFLITVADFFALGDRQAAYLDIAVDVAAVAEGVYFDCIVVELVRVKLKHWDATIRQLAAKAIVRQVSNDKSGFLLKEAVPDLITTALTTGDVLHRHGAILGLSGLLIPLGKLFEKADVERILGIAKSLDRDSCYYGFSGTIVQKAMCSLTEAIAKTLPAALSASTEGRSHAEHMLVFLLRCLGWGMEEALTAYTAICHHVLPSKANWLGATQQRVVEGLTEAKAVQRVRGCALAAGCFDAQSLPNNFLPTLLSSFASSSDVEVRRNLVRSLGRLSDVFNEENIVEVLLCLSTAMADYTVDDRGDVGSWVREAALESVAKIFENFHRRRCSSFDKTGLTSDMVLGILQCIVRQCCERIDRTRVKAGKILLRVHMAVLSFSELSSDLEPALGALSAAFCLKEADIMKEDVLKTWSELFADTARVFTAAARLLQTPCIRLGALQGLVASAGGKGHQSSPARSALTSFWNGLAQNASDVRNGSAELESLGLEISSFFTSNSDRLVAPALCVMEHLTREGCLDFLSDESCLEIAARARKSWSGHLGDIGRTSACVRLLSELACMRQEGATHSVAKRCIEALVVVLAGVVPRLRRIAAEWLYLVLVELGECTAGDELTMAIDILCDIPWEQLKVLEAREVRNKFCDVLNLEKPVAKKKKKTSGAS